MHNVPLRALHDGEQFGLLHHRHFEIVECLLEVVEECLPLRLRDLEIDMRVVHRPARMALRSSGCFAHLLGHQILEARSRDLVMRFVYLGIGVEPWVVHDPIDEIIHDGRNRKHATQSFVESHLPGAPFA